MKRERKERKERENTLLLPTLLRACIEWMLQAELALSRSLKNARGAKDVRFSIVLLQIYSNLIHLQISPTL